MAKIKNTRNNRRWQGCGEKGNYVNYWDLTKIKSFCTMKETISKTKRQPTEWGKIFVNDISDKGYYPKSIKNLSKSTPKKNK